MPDRQKTREQRREQGVTRSGQWELLHGSTGTGGSAAHGGPEKDQRKRVKEQQRNHCVLPPTPVPLAAALEGLSVTHSKNMGGGEVSGVK